MQRQMLPHAGARLASGVLNEAESEPRGAVPQSTAPCLEHGHPPAAPRTRDTPALPATWEDWVQLPSLQTASPGAGCWGPVSSRSRVPFSPCTAPMLLRISPGAAAAGHHERSEAAGIVRAVSTATRSSDSLFDLHFLHPF